MLIASGDCVVEITKRNVYSKKIPKEYIKGTLVSLRSDRKLTGYAAGLDKKIELLKIENITAYR